MRKYCEQCGKETETKVVSKRESYNVCGELIEVDAQVLVCSECGEEFFCEELDSRIGFALQLFNLVHANPNAGRGIFQSCTNVLFGPCGEFLEIHHCVSSLKIKLAHPHTADLADT